jgi:hypothetical protein
LSGEASAPWLRACGDPIIVRLTTTAAARHVRATRLPTHVFSFPATKNVIGLSSHYLIVGPGLFLTAQIFFDIGLSL